MLKLSTAILSTAILTSSLASTGCWNLSYISTIENPEIGQNNPFPKITDDSKIGKYFLSDLPIRLNKSKVMDELEKRIEYSASSYFGRKVEISSPYYLEAGYRIILANRGKLGIIEVQSEPFKKITKEERELAEHYAERKGLNVPLKSLTEIVEGEPKYAAHVSDLGGFAFSLLFTHVIVFDTDKNDLYNVTNTFAHEGTHHFIEMAEIYPQPPVIFYPNERMSIVETACNVIGDKVASQFYHDHLIPGSKLGKNFLATKKLNEKMLDVWQNVIKKFNSYSAQERKENRDQIMQELSDYVSNELKPIIKIRQAIKINEANMSLAERYGGMPERYDFMVEIADKIGPTDFISLISDVMNDKQLKIAHHAIVNLGAWNIDAMRNSFRKEDTSWPPILQ